MKNENTKTLKVVMDDAFKKVTFNRALVQRLYHNRIAFVSKNYDSMNFFGGTLTGYYVVKFTEADTNRIFNDVLDIDRDALTEAIMDVPSINQDFNVSSDTFNLVSVYVIHRFLTEVKLDSKSRLDGAASMALLLNYRYLTSRINHHWQYPCTLSLAQATYEALSDKFLLKKCKSWQKTMEYRAESIYSPESTHAAVLRSFTIDEDIVSMVNDTQNRIRDMIKNIYNIFVQTHASDDRILSSKGVTIDGEGEAILRNRVSKVEEHIDYCCGVATDINSFIKNDLKYIVLDMMSTLKNKERMFDKVLLYFVSEMRGSNKKNMEDIIRMVVVHSHEHVSDVNSTVPDMSDLPAFMCDMKNVYSSSRSSDHLLLELRTKGDKLVKDATGSINANAIAALRTCLFLYILLRTFTKRHFTS